MGWDYGMAKHYRKDGSIDRKAECDSAHTWNEESSSARILRSSMVGSTYYAAVERLNKKTGEKRVIGVVCLTRVDRGDFGMKSMSETMGPCESDCPKSILDLLSPTDDEWALEWRDRCRKRAAERKSKPTLGKLPIGSIIEFERNGTTIRLKKQAPAYQFKTPWWMLVSATEFKYWQKRYIPSDYHVVHIPEEAA